MSRVRSNQNGLWRWLEWKSNAPEAMRSLPSFISRRVGHAKRTRNFPNAAWPDRVLFLVFSLVQRHEPSRRFEVRLVARKTVAPKQPRVLKRRMRSHRGRMGAKILLLFDADASRGRGLCGALRQNAGLGFHPLCAFGVALLLFRYDRRQSQTGSINTQRDAAPRRSCGREGIGNGRLRRQLLQIGDSLSKSRRKNV